MVDVNLISTVQFASLAPEIDTSKYPDVTVSGLISQASKMVSDYIQYTPVIETITDEVKEATISTEGDLIIFPAKLPVVTVSAIKLYKGATTIQLVIVDGNGNNKFNVDFNGRHIRFPFSEITLQGTPIFTNFYSLRSTHFYTKLSYTAGYQPTNIPFALQQATVLYMREILAKQYNLTGATQVRQGQMAFSYSAQGGKSDWVLDAERLLNPYQRIG